MLNIALTLLKVVGQLLGIVSRVVVPLKTFGLRNYLSRSFYTARYRGKFSTFGPNSFLSKDCFIAGKGMLSIGSHSSIQAHTVIETIFPESNIKIGNEVSIGEYCHLTAARCIEIGNGVLTGRFVLISDNSHGCTDEANVDIIPLQRNVTSKGGIIIGRNVWIGDKVSILQNVTIGEGCIIAANAVVTKSIPAFCVVAGNPAKIIKTMKQ